MEKLSYKDLGVGADYGIDAKMEESYREKRRVSIEVLGLIMQDIRNRKSGEAAVDTTGADKYFVDGFINEEMEEEFMAIARDFLRHHYRELPEYDNIAWYDNDRPEQTSPDQALQKKLMNLIYNGAKAGDAYCVELIRYLYKTFHKREYKQLKRFRKISVSEIFALSDDEDGNCSYEAMGRILGMCVINEIELEEQCSVIYLYLLKRREEFDSEEEIEYVEFREGLFKESLEQVEFWMEEEKRKRRADRSTARKYWEEDRFVSACLQRLGYPEDYIYRCEMNRTGLLYLFARTLALLKTVFPKKEFTYEDVQVHAHTLSVVEALVEVCDKTDENLSNLFGLAEEEYEQSPGQQLFHPEQILYQDKKTETPVSVVNRPVNVAPVSSGAKEEDYLKEIAELRQRLREEERKSRYFKEQQNQASIRLRELEATVEKYKSEQDELVALRNYVYESSEEVPRVEKQSYEAMKAAIADRRIVIIGGNDNWVKKLRQEFPGWVYMGARVSGSINSTNVQNAERVYFFTDALGHSNYNKFMQVVRRLQLPFGYMHGVNIYANVAQIYRDFKSEE